MEARHTPGPWRQYPGDPLIIADEMGSSLGEMTPGDPYIGHDEALANAALVAAAPDVLASERENLKVLENLLAYLRKHESSLPPLSTSSLEVRIEATRAAIAKAEGHSDA